jgi:hypothetical protein
MLNIPNYIKKPERNDYRVSEFEIDQYKRVKKRYEHEKYEQQKKNEKSSTIITVVIVWILSFILLSVITNREFNVAAIILITTVIALIIGPFIGGIIFSASEKVIDFVSDEPMMIHTSNQSSAELYDNDLKKYNDTIKALTRRYPDIEKADFNAKEYHKYVGEDLAKLLNESFRRENMRWWNNQILNFKICVDKILRKMNYINIQHTGKLSDPVTAGFSWAVDISAEKDGNLECFRCFRKDSKELNKEIFEIFIEETAKRNGKKMTFVTNYLLSEIPQDLLELAQVNNIIIWDLNKLLELTEVFFVDSSKEHEPPIILSEGFTHCFSYIISRNINESLLTTKPYHYYLLTTEFFESYKDALTEIASFPKEKAYFGVCEYPRKWQYKNKQSIYAIIACNASDGTVWKMAKECEYMYDAYSRQFITNKHEENLGNRSEFMPYFF